MFICVSFPSQPVPSYGTQNAHDNSHSVDVPMMEMHTHKDCIFEVMGDSVNERHTVYYNICQVWPCLPQTSEHLFLESSPASLVPSQKYSMELFQVCCHLNSLFVIFTVMVILPQWWWTTKHSYSSRDGLTGKQAVECYTVECVIIKIGHQTQFWICVSNCARVC